MQKFKALFLLTLASTLFVAACTSSDEDSGIIEGHLDRGREYLEAGYYRPARVEYLKVMGDNGIDPLNCEAQYGHLLTLVFEFSTILGSIPSIKLEKLIGLTKEDIKGLLPSLSPSPSSDLLPTRILKRPHLSPADDDLTPGNVDALITSVLLPVADYYLPAIEEGTTFILENNCTFHSKGIPLTLENDKSLTLWIGEDWGEKEAYLLGGVNSFLSAMVDLIAAHNLDFDLFSTMHALPYIPDLPDAIKNDAIGILRSLAVALYSSPTFLDFEPSRSYRYNNVATGLAKGLRRTAHFINILFGGAESCEEASRDVISYCDGNGDGIVGFGDEIYLGIVKAEPPIDLTIAGLRISPEGYPINLSASSFMALLLWSTLGGEFSTKAHHLMIRLADHLEGKAEGLINLAEFNDLLPADMAILPETIAFDITLLFPDDVSRARPWRHLLPVWGDYKPSGGEGHPVFLTEGEWGEKAAESDFIGTGGLDSPCYVCGPGEHFKEEAYGSYFTMAEEVAKRLENRGDSPEVNTIPDDCVQLTKKGLGTGDLLLPLPYSYWQDPTFNGSIYINLETIRDSEKTCDELDEEYSSVQTDPETGLWRKEEHLKAARYSLNKALSQIIVDFIE